MVNMRFIKYIFVYLFCQFIVSCLSGNNSLHENSNLHQQSSDKKANQPPIISYIDSLNYTTKNLKNWEPALDQHLANFLFATAAQVEINQLKAFNSLLQISSKSQEILKFFIDKIPFYLDNPLSPYYNNQLYCSYLRSTINTFTIDKNIRTSNEILLNHINKNRYGEKASDITFEKLDGNISSLNEVSAEYTILFFFDPTCSHCKEQITQLQTDSEFSNFLNKNNCQFLLINPWGNYEKWKDISRKFPNEWISGIDKDQTILLTKSYYLKAAPTVYLLDNQKKVLLKNTDINTIQNHIQG